MKTNYFKIIFVSIALFAFFGIGNAFASCLDVTTSSTTAKEIEGSYIQGADISGYDAWYNDTNGFSIQARDDDGWFYILLRDIDTYDWFDNNYQDYILDDINDVIGYYSYNGQPNTEDTLVALGTCSGGETTTINPLFSLSQGKATSSAIELSASVGTISTSVFSSFSGYLYLILGILIAWFVIQTIYNFYKDFIEKDKKFEKQTKELIERGNKMTEKIKEYKTKK